jgi:hypothetical protein
MQRDILVGAGSELWAMDATAVGQSFFEAYKFLLYLAIVQKRFFEINPRALYMSCICHSFNLSLGDMAHSCVKTITFFGVIQRLYSLFSGSTKRWKILLGNVPSLTLKYLSNTRLENRIKSVKVIRFQCAQIKLALSELYECCDNDAKTKSEAESLIHALENFEFLLGMIFYLLLIWSAKS